MNNLLELFDEKDCTFQTWPILKKGELTVGTSTGIKAVHLPTGISGISTTERTHHKNREEAVYKIMKKMEIIDNALKTIEVGGKTMHLQPDGTYKAGPPKEKATARAKALKKQAKDIIENRFAETCVKAGLPLPIAEHRFHPTRKWRIDYFFRRGDLKVALEVEGGVWTGGRHTRGAGFLKDIEKYNAAASEGIYLVRTTPDKLFTQGISDVLEVFKNQE